MKRLALIVLSLALCLACDSKEDSHVIKPPIAAPETPDTPEDNTGGTSDNLYYIEDGIEDPIYWVTNEYMQDFMEKVTYSEKNYTVSRIKDFPGGGPGVADIPPAVNLTWENNFPDKKLIMTVWDNEWSREYNLAAGATGQELLNLVPKQRYSYKVITTSGDKVAEGTFRTAGSIHQVYFADKARNSRDLGGWKTLDGKTVAYRKMYRGMRLQGYVTSEGKAEFRAAGIKAELDLREKSSSSVGTNSYIGKDIAFYNSDITDGYVKMLTNYKDNVKGSFEFLAQCMRENKPVYFHCAIGRDRTGTFAMLVLGLLGVSEGDIAKDYELTYFAPDGISTNDGGEFQYTRTKSSAYAAISKHIWNYGKPTFKQCVEAYLLSIGVSQKDMNDIYNAMVID